MPSSEKNPDILFSPTPTAPPTQAGQLGFPVATSSWPTIIGIIAIVMGTLAFLGGLFGILTPFFLNELAAILPDQAKVGFEFFQNWAAWIIGFAITLALVALILLIGGIKLVKRQRNAVKMIRLWAVLKIIVFGGNTFLNSILQQQQFNTVLQQTSTAPATLPPQQFFEWMSIVGIFFGLAWGWSLPVFMLIWFSRKKIKSETVTWA